MKRLLLMLTLAAIYAGASNTAQAQIIIVNAANAQTSLSKAQVSNMFLKRTTKWESGKTVIPVDQTKGAKVRDLFSKTFHGRSTSAIESFWQQQIFSGKDVPPAAKESDADVIAFVKGNPNAIGYVAVGTALGDGVKAVTVSGL